MQFVIDDWQKRFDRPRVAFAAGDEPARDLAWRGSPFPAAGESSGGAFHYRKNLLAGIAAEHGRATPENIKKMA
jgi:hypothetical protein